MVQKTRAATVLKDKQTFRVILMMPLCVGTAIANLSYAATLKVCYDQWAPMTIFPSEGSEQRGVVIDMLEHIYSSEGYELQYYEVPLARGLDMVAEGLCDMLPEYLYSTESEEYFEYANEETFAYTSAFVVRQGDPWRYSGIQSIEGKRIATGPGWDYSSMSADYQSYLDNPENADSVEVIAGYDDVVDRIFEMIRDHRVDLYVDNELVLQHVLNRMNMNGKLDIVRPGLEEKLVEIPIFSKKIPDAERQKLIRIWDEGRLSLIGEQEATILDRYSVTIETGR